MVQEFLRLDNESVIEALENVLHKSKSEMYEQNLKPMSAEQFNAEIDKALNDDENNRLTSARDLKQKIQQWR